MSWEQLILSDAELQRYLPGANSFISRVQALIAQQRDKWPMLRAALTGLAEVEYKKMLVRGSVVLAQFNPKRIISTSARVDEDTIKHRPCFLCPENLPSEERGISFGEDFIVLCNPFPVLPNHLVIAGRKHIPQSIEGNFGELLDLAKELGDQWFAIYNGPRSGASAPDHLHFQACSREILPILRDIEVWDRQTILKSAAIECFILENYRLNLLIARGREREAVIDWCEKTIRRFAEITETAEEPLINLIVIWGAGRWTVILFPRSKHRPSCYHAEGDARLTVSPAAIDLAGVLVVPQPDHFARINAEVVEKIYAEVTISDEQYSRLITRK